MKYNRDKLQILIIAILSFDLINANSRTSTSSYRWQSSAQCACGTPLSSPTLEMTLNLQRSLTDGPSSFPVQLTSSFTCSSSRLYTSLSVDLFVTF